MSTVTSATPITPPLSPTSVSFFIEPHPPSPHVHALLTSHVFFLRLTNRFLALSLSRLKGCESSLRSQRIQVSDESIDEADAAAHTADKLRHQNEFLRERYVTRIVSKYEKLVEGNQRLRKRVERLTKRMEEEGVGWDDENDEVGEGYCEERERDGWEDDAGNWYGSECEGSESSKFTTMRV